MCWFRLVLCSCASADRSGPISQVVFQRLGESVADSAAGMVVDDAGECVADRVHDLERYAGCIWAGTTGTFLPMRSSDAVTRASASVLLLAKMPTNQCNI